MKRIYSLCISLMPLMICSGMVYSIFSLYLFDLGISRTRIGLIYTAGSLSGSVCSPLFGRISDRVGRKPIIILSFAIFSLVFFLYAISRSFLGILPIQMLEGAMWAAFSVVTPAFIADIARDGERGAYLGLYNQVWYIGWAIGPLFGGFLTDAFGFQSSFIICSLSLLLGLGLVLRLVRED